MPYEILNGTAPPPAETVDSIMEALVISAGLADAQVADLRARLVETIATSQAADADVDAVRSGVASASADLTVLRGSLTGASGQANAVAANLTSLDASAEAVAVRLAALLASIPAPGPVAVPTTAITLAPAVLPTIALAAALPAVLTAVSVNGDDTPQLLEAVPAGQSASLALVVTGADDWSVWAVRRPPGTSRAFTITAGQTDLSGVASFEQDLAPPTITNATITPAGDVVGTVFVATATIANAETTALQWLLNGVAIAGATASTYTSTAPGALTARISATNAVGTEEVTLAAAVTQAPAIAAVSISPASGVVGTVFTVNATITGTPTPTPSYQWAVDGVPISGATLASYNSTGANAGVLSARVTADNGVGTAATATATATLAFGGPALVLLPGGTIEAVAGTAGGWALALGLDGGAAANYSVTEAQLVTGAANLAPPAVTGNAAIGEILTATPGLWLVDGALNLSASYQWLRGGTAISGATGATYTVAGADAGASLSVRETVGTQSATSAGLAIPSSLYSFTDTFDQHANDTRLKDLAEWDPVYTNNGDIKVVSGEAGMFANADQIIRFVPTLAQKRYIEADMANAVQGAFNTALALFPRYADSSNRIGLAIQANFAVTQTSGGTFSTLYSDPAAMAAGTVVRVEVDGGTVRYVRDGVLKWTGTTTVLTGQPAMKAQSAAWPIDHNRIGSIKIGELA